LFRIQEVKLDQAKSRLLSQILCDVDGEIQESLYWDTGKVVSACAVVANWKESESCIKMAEADNSNGKISSIRVGGGVRQKIRAFSRKISTMERKDIDPHILRKLATFIVGFFIVCYSIKIFVHLLSLLYPSFQTTKVIQV